MDKFGHPIYGRAYEDMLILGNRLLKQGFIESRKKPNLFYKKINSGAVFADMRGTEEVRIWQDPVPLLYYSFDEDTQLWKRHRISKAVEQSLDRSGLQYRKSFYSEIEGSMDDGYFLRDRHVEAFGTEELFWESIYVETEDAYYPDLTKVDGFCKICYRDISRNTLFCDRCFKIELQRRRAKEVFGKYNEALGKLEKCAICGDFIYMIQPASMRPSQLELELWLNRFLPVEGVLHHTSYFPELTMAVCKGCHYQIHNTKKYIEYRPPKGDSSKFYNKKRNA